MYACRNWRLVSAPSKDHKIPLISIGDMVGLCLTENEVLSGGKVMIILDSQPTVSLNLVQN